MNSGFGRYLKDYLEYYNISQSDFAVRLGISQKHMNEILNDVIKDEKLQKLMTMNAIALEGLKAKKIVLNQSLLTKKDVANFEYEAKVRVFYNLPPLNERDRKLPELNKMLVQLGLNRQKSEI